MSDFRVVTIKTEANLYQAAHEVEQSSSRCGEIYVGDNAKKWTFICTLCDKCFCEIDEFMSHIKVWHINIPPLPSAEPQASGHVSMQQDSFKCEGPSFNALGNGLIDEFVDYNDFLDADVQDVPSDVVSETTREIEVPVNQDVKPDIHLRCRGVSNSEVAKTARSSNSSAKSCSPRPSIKHTKKVKGSGTDIPQMKNKNRRFCHICQRKFQYRSPYRKHMAKHATDRPFQCRICKRDFKSKQSVRYHVKTHEREKPFQCEVCSLGFHLEARFVSHMETHTTSNSHPCEVCGKLNRSNADKVIHMRTHTEDNPFACKHCSRRFRSRNNLGNHLKLHFTYRCQHCRKQFHNGVPMMKPYTCPGCCGKTDVKGIDFDYDEDEDSEDADDEEKDVTFHPEKYTDREILEPNRPRYVCKYCKKTYASKRGLSRHISVKH